MAEPSRPVSTPRRQTATVRVGTLAANQFGRISYRQLRACGVSAAGIHRLLSRGWLHRIHRGIYAVGHLAQSREADLAAAVLYAGERSALSHLTAVNWLGISVIEPSWIDVSAPGRRSSIPGIRIHHPHEIERIIHRGLPVTTAARALLDSAALIPFPRLRRLLADAEYQRLVTLDEVEAVLGRGQPGAAALRRALEMHRPALARTLSELEERFVALCERARLPMPEVNATVEGLMVDALWRGQRVIVELDGHRAHANPAATERDRARELKLRAAGYTVLRYTWRQITEESDAVIADLRSVLGL